MSLSLLQSLKIGKAAGTPQSSFFLLFFIKSKNEMIQIHKFTCKSPENIKYLAKFSRNKYWNVGSQLGKSSDVHLSPSQTTAARLPHAFRRAAIPKSNGEMNEDAELTGTVRFLKTISNKAEHSSFQVERKRLYAFKRKNTKGMLDYTWGRKKKAWRKNITRPLQVIPPKNAIMQTAYSKFLRH